MEEFIYNLQLCWRPLAFMILPTDSSRQNTVKSSGQLLPPITVMVSESGISSGEGYFPRVICRQVDILGIRW